METIQIKTKLQVITYETPDGQLAREYATSEKRISIVEAGEILLSRGIEFKQIVKVKYENMQLDLPLHDLESYIL